MIIEYEVWQNYGGHPERFIAVTPSLKEARQLAKEERDNGEEGIEVLWFDDDGNTFYEDS